ncbi:MAG TPA: VOC family protein [Cellulomonas sp.]|uniref:VOC family protein n=1 Tax=Cellulomonas sp. TaxID=40001 RepID=UPI002E30FB4B|nr:VOC family protein [Cellulomonas sp.]HEX5334115.1 VOC family protein [Cellulomonas sp.]
MGLVVGQLSVDCGEPAALAQWWAQVLGWHVVGSAADDEDNDALADEDEVGIEPDDGSPLGVLFLRVPEAKSVKNRLHLDLRPQDGSDQETELARLIELGARPVDIGQGLDVTWYVLVDPEGNEFCLLRSTPSQLAEALADVLD